MRAASTGGGAVRDPGNVWRPGVTDQRKAMRSHAAERLVMRILMAVAIGLCWNDGRDPAADGRGLDVVPPPGGPHRLLMRRALGPDARKMVRLNLGLSGATPECVEAATYRKARQAGTDARSSLRGARSGEAGQAVVNAPWNRWPFLRVCVMVPLARTGDIPPVPEPVAEQTG